MGIPDDLDHKNHERNSCMNALRRQACILTPKVLVQGRAARIVHGLWWPWPAGGRAALLKGNKRQACFFLLLFTSREHLVGLSIDNSDCGSMALTPWLITAVYIDLRPGHKALQQASLEGARP